MNKKIFHIALSIFLIGFASIANSQTEECRKKLSDAKSSFENGDYNEVIKLLPLEGGCLSKNSSTEYQKDGYKLVAFAFQKLEKQHAEFAQNAFEIAEEKAAKAKQRQYQQLAKAMSLRSLQMETEEFREIKGLLAEQAYTFYTNNEGNPMSSEVYNSVYSALKFYGNPITKKIENAYAVSGDILLLPVLKKDEIYSVHQNGEVIKWNGINGSNEKVKLASSEGFTVKSVSLSLDNRFLAMGGRDKQMNGYVEIHDLSGQDKVIQLNKLGKGVTKVAFGPSNQLFILDDLGKNLSVYQNTQIKKLLPSDTKWLNIVVSPKDETTVYLSNENGNIVKYNTVGKQSELVVEFNAPINAINVGTYFPYLIYGDQNGTIHFQQDGKTISIPAHKAAITQLAISSDGKYLASASFDETVRIWDLSNLSKESILLNDHNDKVSNIAFSADNSRLIASTRTRTISFWPVQLSDFGDKICQNLTRNMTNEEWQRYVPGVNYQKTCPNIIEQ